MVNGPAYARVGNGVVGGRVGEQDTSAWLTTLGIEITWGSCRNAGSDAAGLRGGSDSAFQQAAEGCQPLWPVGRTLRRSEKLVVGVGCLN